jgi:tetracycline repressor-like protein
VPPASTSAPPEDRGSSWPWSATGGLEVPVLPHGLIPRFSQAVDVPEANVAAALSHQIGLTLVDTVIELEQLNRLANEDLVHLVEPAVRRYLLPSR